ncbi:hypothetical protein GCM10009789_38550 [Kribbella sancticallisti]|uniref:Major facilitator superfamily (MFS) profile domain-containing protein n=1 Tax=Kribbella sancticallisti TaxID=460087 RepID=A0ABP4PKP8_9ACTN
MAIGAPVFTAIGIRFGRRSMLLLTTTSFLLGNILSALGSNYEVIMAGRIVSAAAHGAFLGIAAVYAVELVDRARKGRAVAIVFSGLTASTVLGAPIGAAVGQLFGWRYTFWTMVVFGGIALVGLMAPLPAKSATSTGDHPAGHGDHNSAGMVTGRPTITVMMLPSRAANSTDSTTTRWLTWAAADTVRPCASRSEH